MDTQRAFYEVCVSQHVLDEARRGDPVASSERLAILQTLPLVEMTTAALELAKELVGTGALPEKSLDDAVHVAVAASNHVRYLLTWNCRHLANAKMRPLIEAACRTKGFEPPIICTPEELLGG